MPLLYLSDSNLAAILGGGDWRLDVEFKAMPQIAPELKLDFGVKTNKVSIVNSFSTNGSTWEGRLTTSATTGKLTASSSFVTDGHDWATVGSIGFRW